MSWWERLIEVLRGQRTATKRRLKIKTEKFEFEYTSEPNVAPQTAKDVSEQIRAAISQISDDSEQTMDDESDDQD